MSYWKRKRAEDEAREKDIERARAELAQAQEAHQEVLDRGAVIADLASYLAERRTQNHFGDALTEAFTPRRRHA